MTRGSLGLVRNRRAAARCHSLARLKRVSGSGPRGTSPPLAASSAPSANPVRGRAIPNTAILLRQEDRGESWRLVEVPELSRPPRHAPAHARLTYASSASSRAASGSSSTPSGSLRHLAERPAVRAPAPARRHRQRPRRSREQVRLTRRVEQASGQHSSAMCQPSSSWTRHSEFQREIAVPRPNGCSRGVRLIGLVLAEAPRPQGLTCCYSSPCLPRQGEE